MNIPYKSIYEALPDHKANLATKGRTELLKGTNTFNKLKQKEIIKKIETYIKTINSLINKFRNTLPKTNPKKLKIKESNKFLNWKISLFPKVITSSYSEIASIKFSPSQEKMKDKIMELFKELNKLMIDTVYEHSTEFLPEKYASFENVIQNNDWAQKGSMADTTYDINDLIKLWTNIGITPATDYDGIEGMYRLHATNPPPACLKGQYTGKAGMGLLMYKSFIHYCGHGFTGTQSSQAKKVWVSIKQDTDIISFEYEQFKGLLAISTLLPKESVIKILDRFISQSSKKHKSFYEWCKYRMNEGTNLEDILDNELYALIEKDIEQIKAGVLQSDVDEEFEDEKSYEDDEDDKEYLFDIENFTLQSLFYDGFSNDNLLRYVKLFRKDTYQLDFENLLDEGLDEFEAEQEMKSRMRDLKIVEYWEDATGENLYDTYLDYYQRQNGEQVTTSRVVDGYGIDIDSFKKDGMYYDSVVYMFNRKINELERYVIREEEQEYKTNRSNTKKSGSDTTTSNYMSKGNRNEVFDIVDSEDEAKQKVNISNLKWKLQNNPMTIEQAVRNTPSGYRLPTIQELYTKMINSFTFNDNYYWSSSRMKYMGHWYIDSKDSSELKLFTTLDKNSEFYVAYVKDI